MTHGHNLLSEPDPVLLPDDIAASTALDDGRPPAEVAAANPTASSAWSLLAQDAFGEGRIVEAYAYARTGYHRGLDALRRNGWKGFGPVPWAHAPNRGFLRCVWVLGRAAAAIGEADEATRCAALLNDCDPAAAPALAD